MAARCLRPRRRPLPLGAASRDPATRASEATFASASVPRRRLSYLYVRCLAITPANDTERRILADPDWQSGVAWGDPRPGHPEGRVGVHVEQVLANVERVAVDESDRERLRFVALIHDTFKHQVDRNRPREGENHHAMIARRFAERYTSDAELLDVIELHDEAFNAWVKGDRGGNWDAAEARARRLRERLGASTGFYLRFYRADNETGSKDQTPLHWFERVSGE
jgi:HD domain